MPLSFSRFVLGYLYISILELVARIGANTNGSRGRRSTQIGPSAQVPVTLLTLLKPTGRANSRLKV